MATKRKTSKRSSQGGSTLYGVLAGLLIGLVVAAAVAFYVTKAPMPFVDRASRGTPDNTKQPDPRNAPDPNQGLYGRDGPAGTAPTGPTATSPAPLPDTPDTPRTGPIDDLGALIATLPSSTQAPAQPAPAAPGTGTSLSGADKPAAKPAPNKPAAVASAAPSASGSGTYFLQAGAYRKTEDADALKARILMLGLPVNVTKAEVNGVQVNRVRVGPFAKLDDMNRARSRLGENKIESAVVRQ
ncbi:SPOR domain-containing protein [Bordetella genomosp. 1]|uniref:Cell division protein n=1 Tax=Bordetella genomosp. 1 TaxID=1395607 RepID=A0ABX4F491_9BORD|nr:SPOR domain-containing protein [Bordetella genomosp. 1]MDQ8030422.1 SPOR domain-containing protein [Bordetella sp.]OZI68487.1 cell division protein [Bordetella genomosp. 1]